MAKKYNYEKNGIPYFRKTRTIGHKPDGTPIKKEFYGDGEKDCDRQIQEYMDKLKKGLNMNTENMTVEEGMHYWLFNVLHPSKNKKSASFDKHECNYRNYIKNKRIGCIKIQNAVSAPFQEYYNELYKNGINIKNTNTGQIIHRDVSSIKIFDLNKTLRSFFSYCIKQHLTLDNPCIMQNIEIPGDADGEEDEADKEGNNIQAFNDNDMEILKSNLVYLPDKDNTFTVMIQLGFLTGLRLGELLGLKKKFVEQYLIKVRNTLKRVKVFDTPTTWHRETKLIKPKFKASIRNVNFPITFWNTIEKYFKEQELKWKMNKLEFYDDSLIFTTDSCNPIDMTNFSRAWKRFLNRIDVDYKKPHSMRDTYATTLIRRGASIYEVKELLGHSSIKITEKYYIYVFPEDKSKVAKLMDDIFI